MTGDATPRSPRTLGASFPPAELEDWRARARAALGGADIEALVRRTRDGHARGPLSTRADRPSPAPAALGRSGPWDNRVEIRASDLSEANALALEALEGGASSIELRIDPSGQAGVKIASLADLDRALSGVALDAAAISLADAGAAMAALLPALWARRGTPDEARRGALNLDPFRPGGEDGETQLNAAARLAGAPFTALRADSRAVHEAGRTEAEELGWAAACGAACLEGLARRGIPVGAAARSVAFALALDSDMHMGIAKLRALRRIWTRIASSAGAPGAVATVQAFSSRRLLETTDPATNLLRLTAAAMAAALGGADSITLAPYAAEPAERARRLSRNIPLLIAEEAGLGRAEDPARGGFHHEALTEALAAAAWARFQQIMGRGGPAAERGA